MPAKAEFVDVPDGQRVCVLGDGPAVSFMDRAAVYDRNYYNAALSSGIKCQPKAAVAGGNNSGEIHLSRGGVRTLAISVPCRYIHSPSCVACKEDIENALISLGLPADVRGEKLGLCEYAALSDILPL